MAKKRGTYSRGDPRILVAADIWQKSPHLTNWQALRAAKYLNKESDAKAIRSRLARLVPNIRELQIAREEDLLYLKQVKKVNQVITASSKVADIEQK